MSLFAGIEDVKASQEGMASYFLPGKYRVQVEKAFVFRKRLGGHLFVAEMTVLASDNPEIMEGGQRNWVQSFELETAMSRIKVFIAAAKGLCPKRQRVEIEQAITQAACDEVVSDANPLKGRILDLEAQEKISKRTEKPFTIHIWNPAASA